MGAKVETLAPPLDGIALPSLAAASEERACARESQVDASIHRSWHTAQTISPEVGRSAAPFRVLRVLPQSVVCRVDDFGATKCS